MATSGTSAFTLDVIELIEEAYEQAGTEMRSGYDLRTARRSLDLLALEWGNRGYNLWTVEEGSIPLLTGVGAYSLPADTIDIVEDFALPLPMTVMCTPVSPAKSRTLLLNWSGEVSSAGSKWCAVGRWPPCSNSAAGRQSKSR